MSKRKLAAYLTFGWFPHAVGYVIAPNALAAAAKHAHASVGLGPWSLGAIPLVAAGVFLIAWAIVTHYRDSPAEVQTSLPTYLSRSGAYSVSRNPLYLGGALLWAGWALAWLSIAVVAGGLLLFGFFATIGIPYEERNLAARHGSAYDEYRQAVPRWISLRRSARHDTPACAR